MCTSAVKFSCRENNEADGDRTLVLALLTAVNCKEMLFFANQIVPIVRNNDATCMIIKQQELPHANQNILELHGSSFGRKMFLLLSAAFCH